MKLRSAIPALFVGGLAALLVLTSIIPAETRTGESHPSVRPLVERVAAEKPAQVSLSGNVDISHVVVKFRDDAGVRLRANRMIALSNVSATAANELLAPYLDKGLRRLFAAQDKKLNSLGFRVVKEV